MASEWRTHRLGDIAEIFDGPHATPAKTPVGPVFLGIWNLSQGRLDLSETEHLSEEDWNRWSRRVTPRPGDVVFSYETRLGEAASIPTGLRCCLGRRMGLLRPRSQDVDGRFLLYAYLGPAFQDTIRERTVYGSTVDRIPLVEMPEFPITLPGPTEQRAIAHVLGTLDDKIDLNRKMNESLEAMARALFKSWFVHFDPVRAKAEGRDTGLPADIASIFPDSFEDSELGEIPVGWKAGRVMDLGKVVCGKTPPTSDPENYGTDLPFVTIPDMHGNVFVTETNRYLSTKGAATQPGKTVPPYAICVSCIATVGLVALTSQGCQTNQQINSIVPSEPAEAPYFYFALRERRREIRARGGGGSVVLNLNTSQFSSLPILVPDPAAVSGFQRFAKPVLDRILSNERESQSLGAIRDTLLPRLISGKLRVAGAERIVGGQA